MKSISLLAISLATIANSTLWANPPIVLSADGEYLGVLSANPYEPESISNPRGLFGSKYSPVSVEDKFGLYGSPYSNESLNNERLVSEPQLDIEETK